MKKFSTLLAALAITLAVATVALADNGNGNDNDCTDVATEAACAVLQADANCDGVITATDVSYILQVAVHLLSADDIPCCEQPQD